MTAFDRTGPFAVTFEDVPYATPDSEPLLARIYRPANATGPLPALVDVHGGAWTLFDRTADAYFDRALAACGMVVAALDFRQAPAHRYPTAVADVVAGVRFVKANAAALGVDPSRVGLIGGSSGGHLLLLAALRPNAPEFDGTPYTGMTDERVDAGVAFALPLWPIADPLVRYRYLEDRIAHPVEARDPFFRPDRLKLGHDAFFGDVATMDRAGVSRLLDAGEAERLPPVWIAHPERDENVTLDMTHDLVEAYRRTGGHAELEVFAGVGHSFANFPGYAADGCIARMKEFIGRQMELR